MDQKFVLCFYIFQLNISEKMIFINVWRHVHQQGFHLVRKTFLAIILCQHKYLHLLFKNLKKVLQMQPPEVFCKRGFLKNFAKFTGKYLCQSPGPATLWKRRLRHRCFPENFAKLLRKLFYRKPPVAAFNT